VRDVVGLEAALAGDLASCHFRGRTLAQRPEIFKR
jgi:hypothetical protein